MINEELPKRKHPRLKEFDYSSDGYYYITICTIGKKCCLGYVPKRKDINVAPQPVLSDMGKIARKYIESMSRAYQGVFVDNYVVMPNHVHLLILLNNKCMQKKTSIFQIVKAFKRLTAKEIGFQIWQKSYFDEIIKNDSHLENVRNYIEYNACKWEDDKYFMQ